MKVSIACLIYKSIKYLKFVKSGIEENTSMLASGEAEFYFVVNFKRNCSEKVIKYLRKQNISHSIFDKNPDQPNYPKNIKQIYEAWNYAVKMAKGEIVVLLNSDMYPCCNRWLEDMLKWYKDDRIITARLVEPGKLFSHLPHTVVQDFGRTIETFNKENFQKFANSIKTNRAESEGTFMPMMINRELFLKTGGYPEGNPIWQGQQISGDWYFFHIVLKNFGIEFLNVQNVIFYHIQEGEVDS